MDLDFEGKFRHIIKKMEESGIAYAEAKGQSWQMQELKGSVFAKIVKETGINIISKAEVMAESSDEYRSYICDTAEAIKKELRLKAEYEKWKSSFEALRSLSSLEKATRSNTGGNYEHVSEV